MFKQTEIMVIMLYILPNNKEERKKIQRTIIKRYIKCQQRIQIIVIRDFNSVVDLELDKSESSKARTIKQDLLLKWLTRQNFRNAYRLVNPEKKEFSWSGRGSESKLIKFELQKN